MRQLRYLCSLYGSQNYPMSGTREMIYDIGPLCEDQKIIGKEEISRDEILK